MRKRFSSGTLSLVLALVYPGCVDNNSDSPVVILYNQVPGSGCTITNSDSSAAIIRGFIDTQSPVGYAFTPVIKNFASTSTYVEPAERIAYLEGANITVNLDDRQFTPEEQSGLAATGFSRYRTSFGAVVPPDEGTVGLLIELIPTELLREVGARLPSPADRSILDVTIRMFGSLAGGGIETQDFAYTVEACNGCLINNLGACSTVSQVVNTGGKCNPLQDTTLVDCCTENDILVCPAVPTSPAAR